MSDNIDKGFHDGRKDMIDILDDVSGKSPDEMFGYYSGFLTTLIDCIYSTAPTPVLAENLIDLSIQQGIEDATRFKKD